MRRRTWFATTVVLAASLAVGVGMAGAAAPAAMKLTCKMSLSTTPPSGTNIVDQPSSQGSQYGAVHCPRHGFGPGLAGDSFTVPDSGDTVGKYTQYFKTGSITGSFDMTPQEAPIISVGNFLSETWLGTIKITGGTGTFSGIKQKKGTGVLKCSTVDSVHLSCTEKIFLKTI